MNHNCRKPEYFITLLFHPCILNPQGCRDLYMNLFHSEVTTDEAYLINEQYGPVAGKMEEQSVVYVWDLHTGNLATKLCFSSNTFLY